MYSYVSYYSCSYPNHKITESWSMRDWERERPWDPWSKGEFQTHNLIPLWYPIAYPNFLNNWLTLLWLKENMSFLHIFLGSTPKAQLNTILVMVDFLVHVYCFLSFYFYLLECLWFQKIKAKPSVVLSQFLVKICCEWELFFSCFRCTFL